MPGATGLLASTLLKSVGKGRPIRLTNFQEEAMSATVYEAPALQEIGDFEELTMCLWDGICHDICGGWAAICIW